MADNSVLKKVSFGNARLTAQSCSAYLIGTFFLLSFFLSTAPLRIAFYAFSPFFLTFLYQNRAWLISAFKKPLGLLYVSFFGYYALSFFWSTEVTSELVVKFIRDSFFITVFVSTVALLIAKVRFVVSKSMVKYVVGSVVGASMLYMAYFLVNDITFGVHRFAGFGRYENPIHYGTLLAFSALFLFCYRRHLGIKKHRRLFVSVLFMVLFSLLLLTESRSAILALIASLFTISILERNFNLRVFISVALISICIVGSLWGFSSNDFFERFDTDRLGIWTDVLAKSKDSSLFFGTGYNEAARFYVEKNDGMGWKSAHNIYLGTFYLGGLAGLCVFLTLLYQCIKISFSSFKSQDAPESEKLFAALTLSFLVILLVMGMFNYHHFFVGAHIQWLVFWLPVSMCLALQQKEA